jgi:hypothetical protein
MSYCWLYKVIRSSQVSSAAGARSLTPGKAAQGQNNQADQLGSLSKVTSASGDQVLIAEVTSTETDLSNLGEKIYCCKRHLIILK